MKIDRERDGERGGADGEARGGRIFERNLQNGFAVFQVIPLNLASICGKNNFPDKRRNSDIMQNKELGRKMGAENESGPLRSKKRGAGRLMFLPRIFLTFPSAFDLRLTPQPNSPWPKSRAEARSAQSRNQERTDRMNRIYRTRCARAQARRAKSLRGSFSPYVRVLWCHQSAGREV